MFSSRLPWSPPENALAASVRAAAASGDLFDLTETNPTGVGLVYPTSALRDALSRADVGRYAPAPLGLAVAREAVAAEYARAGVGVAPDRVVITASSSESYAFLFKLLADPGDAVLVPEPSYPLHGYLAPLDGVATIGYRLAFDGAWHIDFDSLAEALAEARKRGARPRAIVVVSPNNPTGSFIKGDELERLAELCDRHDLALVADEVFGAYPFEADASRVPVVAVDPRAAAVPCAFSLGGLSKACGLPQLKLGWIAVGGRDAAPAISALELIADTYLSVATPVQSALADLLRIGAEVRGAISSRVAVNRAVLDAARAPTSTCSVLPAEGGWSAVLRVPATRSDEAWASALVREARVLVHPGYFFDFRAGCQLVASLLPPTERFTEGLRRLFALVDASAG